MELPYRGIVSRLRDGFRCVAVDYLGFGLSERPERYGYTIEEHARTVGELVDHLGLGGFIVMGQDWGGPIGTAVATERADRVAGVVLGNTWFWPADWRFKTFSMIMSSRPIQRRILEKNFFVERLMPTAMTRRLTPQEMDHYRKPPAFTGGRAWRRRDAEGVTSRATLLERLAREVPARLGNKRALFVWGMKDMGFRPKLMLPRMRAAFPDHEVVELPNAKHYIQEDAPDEIAEAIAKRFG